MLTNQTTDQIASVAVVGAGAIGTLLGAYLHMGGKAKVSLVGRGPHIEAIIREKCLKIKFPGKPAEETIPSIDAYTEVGVLKNRRPDWVILSVRTYQTNEAMQQIVETWGEDVPVVTFQNGYTLDKIQDFVGKNAVGGQTLISSKVVEPGSVHQPQHTGLYVGEINEKDTSRVQNMCDAFGAVQQHVDCMEAHVTDNVVGAIWAKLAVNATNNVLTAVTDLSVRQMYEHPETQLYSYGLVTETLKVAKLEEVDISATPVALAKAFAEYSSSFEKWRGYLRDRAPTLGHFKLSMSDMLDRNIKTEVDDINGYIVERARAHGIRVPHHEAILEVVHKIERREMERGLTSLPKIA